DQDQRENISISDLKLEDNTRKSTSVIEKMMTTGHEKTRKLVKSTGDSSERKLQTVEGQIVTDMIQEVSMDDKSEHVEVKNTSKDFDKEHCLVSTTINRKIILLCLSWYLYRSLSFSPLKKHVKVVPSSPAVSPQYLGTLKVLEDKRLQKYSAETGKADSLRAAVYQDWLEKKIVFLLELKRIKKKQDENLRNDIEKKEAIKREEAIASFEAWKAMKEREAKKLSEKRKLEELEKKRVAEQDEEKREAAQKVMNEKKEECIKQKKVEKILERRKQEMQQVKKEEKDKRAVEEYERWLVN
ncbi:MAP9 protein, partial [Dromaius novaehollandiae]|nr:MAP9 protein [Dromaius novaehollandiae]